MKMLIKYAASTLALTLIAGAVQARPLPDLNAQVDQSGTSQEANVTQNAAVASATVTQTNDDNTANVSQTAAALRASG